MEQVSIVETVEKLELSDKDVLHVKLGGDLPNMPPWIPSDEDCERHRQEWVDALGYLGLDVKVIVTHQFVDLKIIRPTIDFSQPSTQKAFLDLLRELGVPTRHRLPEGK